MPNKKSRVPVPQYSYRQNLTKENRKIYRRIGVIIAAFFVVLLIVWFMGINFISSLSLLSNGNDSSQDTTASQDQPLLTPTVDSLPEATNQDTIIVNGQTSGETQVKLFNNTKEIAKVESDNLGNFKFEKVKLNEGSNLLKVVVTKDNESEQASVTIILDKTKPNLTISGPVDGASLPASSKTVNVNGTTEANAIVHVSGNQAVVESSGKFSYNLPVSSGENKIDVNSVDLAGNVTTVALTVTVETTVIPDGPSQ